MKNALEPLPSVPRKGSETAGFQYDDLAALKPIEAATTAEQGQRNQGRFTHPRRCHEHQIGAFVEDLADR